MRRTAHLVLAFLGLAFAWIAGRAALLAEGLLSGVSALCADAVFIAACGYGLYLALRVRDHAQRDTEEKFRLAINLQYAWYWEIDTNLCFTRLEGAALENAGLDVATSIGKPSRHLFNFELMDMTSEDFALLRARREPYRAVRARMTTVNGSLRYVSINGDPMHAPDGSFSGYRGITRDITAQVEAEQAREEGERNFRRLVETLPNLVFFVTNLARDRWLYRSPNWGKLWNYDGPAPKAGRLTELLDRILPEDRPLFHGRAAAESRGEVVEIEYRCMIPERGLRWMHTRTIGVPAGDGEVEVYGVTEDVTERRLALDRVSASNALQRSVLASMAEGLIVRDAEGRVTAANEAAERILGRSTGGLLGHTELEPRRETVREDGTPFLLEEFPPMRVLRTGKPVLGVVMGSHRTDGTRFWIRVNAVPLGESSRAPDGVVTTFQDITAERAARSALAELAATLEKRVAERTDALTKTNRELEAFAHSVSHDLRAPLRTINGFARLLADREGFRLDSESRRLLSRIEAGAGRMGELIDDVIEYSSATRREPEYATLDLDRLAASVVARLTHAYPAARVDIGPLGTLYADPRMVEKILEALLGNALKFSARVQKPQVLIRADSAEGQTIVHVTDNGSGFDMAHTSHLFVLFRRLHHDHEFPGTGVGLATVRNLVERQGGTVSAHSAPGQGATFSFRLQTAAPPDSIQCAGVLGGTAGER